MKNHYGVMNMDFFDTVSSRRSIRAYTDEPVSGGDLRKILDAAHAAPSAGNMQPRDIVVVTDSDTRMQLSEAAYGQEFVARAPVVLVFCAVPSLTKERYGSRGENLYCQQDVAAAVENAALAACALGLGSCWVGAFDPTGVSGVLGIPDGVEPQAMLPVGHPAKSPRPTPRRGRDSEHAERW
jgi:nitroreductase